MKEVVIKDVVIKDVVINECSKFKYYYFLEQPTGWGSGRGIP